MIKSIAPKIIKAGAKIITKLTSYQSRSAYSDNAKSEQISKTCTAIKNAKTILDEKNFNWQFSSLNGVEFFTRLRIHAKEIKNTFTKLGIIQIPSESNGVL
eukprot:TRINITY_DN5192_c0_g1_i15.p5 TRINITY_DN5192_c0_g1~~TRINITY_DN5192_c0_g1_i15.p5  ORF type:complete len:101 (+),score=4.67 TRINITY_DN5192_c0_g1_i15:331-633(+)